MNPSPSSIAILNPDLEIKDAQLIFNRVWKGLEKEIGRENLLFPKELILLGGAPGSGKGTNTAFICRVRGITAAPIVISQLLDSDRKSTRLNSSHLRASRMPSSA